MNSSTHLASPSPGEALSPLTQSLLRTTAKKLSATSPKRATVDVRKVLSSPLPKKLLFASNLPTVGESSRARIAANKENALPSFQSTPSTKRFSSIGPFKTSRKAYMRTHIPHIVGGKKKHFQTERKANRSRRSTTYQAWTDDPVPDGGISDFLQLALNSKSLEVQELRKEVKALRPAKDDLEARVLQLVSERDCMAADMKKAELDLSNQLKQLPRLIEMIQRLENKVAAQDAKLETLHQQLVSEKETRVEEVNSVKQQFFKQKTEFDETLAKQAGELEELRQLVKEKKDQDNTTHQDSRDAAGVDVKEGQTYEDHFNGSGNNNGAGDESYIGDIEMENQEQSIIPRTPPRTTFGLLSPNSVCIRRKALKLLSNQPGKRKGKKFPTDALARAVGYYVATIDGKEREFPRLCDAMKARDVIPSPVPNCKAQALNLSGDFNVVESCSNHDESAETCAEDFEAGQNVWVVSGKTEHAAVVQTINSEGKIAMVKWTSTGRRQEVNLFSIRPMHKKEASMEKSSSSRYSRRNRRQTTFFS